jgi:predicted RND superfamily exporter protein
MKNVISLKIILIIVVAIYGITRIQINDNPVKWFAKNHPIRQADIELQKAERAYKQAEKNYGLKVQQAKAERSEKTGITAERALKEIYRLATFDPRKLFNEDGTIKPIHDLDDDTVM